MWKELLILLPILHLTYGIRWVGLAKITIRKDWNTTSDCRKARKYGLVSSQIQICLENSDLMDSIVHAARLSTRTCQQIFVNTRWNCSSMLGTPRITADLNTGTREQAYVYAISSAALTHSIARTCSLGLTANCGCGRLPDSPTSVKFKWDGCSDNMPYGIGFATQFTDSPYDEPSKYRRFKRSKKILMNQHNNASGRKVVNEGLRTKCKCHGISGSCATKTCWRAVEDFKALGQRLRSKYAVAVAVTKRRQKNAKRLLVPVSRKRRAFRDDELIYINASPDYCYPDRSTGSMGTKGRLCDKDSRGSSGCASMCCGRGFRTRHYEKIERCHCKYVWCCFVKCKKCKKSITEYRCR